MGVCPTLDLRRLNKYTCHLRFRMILVAIIPVLQAQDWFSALNLQDAYVHVAVHLGHRKYLRFKIGHNHYH